MADIVLETRISPELDEALGRLTSARGTTKSRLVREVPAAFVLTEERFDAAVAEDRAAVEAGDVLDHDEVMRQVDALLVAKVDKADPLVASGARRFQ